MYKSSDVLRQARALIADPERWCQRVGRIGERRCALTALEDASHAHVFTLPSRRSGYERAYGYLYHAAGQQSIVDVNDTRDHAAVLRMYDEAIRLAEAAEGRGE